MHARGPRARFFNNACSCFSRPLAPVSCRDNTKGSDSWAVSQGYVAVTPLTLLSDVPTSAEAHQDRAEAELVRDLRAVLRVAGAEAALAFSEAGAVDDGLQDANAARAVPLSNWQ